MAITTTVHVELLDEGTPTLRMVDALSLGSNLYKLFSDEHYHVDTQNWEFLPGAIVRCVSFRNRKGKNGLLAVEQIESPPYSSKINVRLFRGKQTEIQLKEAISLGKNIYKLLPDSTIATSDGDWEFLPGTIVRCEDGYPIVGIDGLLAVEQVG